MQTRRRQDHRPREVLPGDVPHPPAHVEDVLRDYDLRRDELVDWFAIMNGRDGMHVLHDDSGFVTDHKAQGERLDFARLYRAYRDEITFTFTVTGAEGDVLEGRQTIAARDRLRSEGLDVRLHPGGHLTTHEHPDLLAGTIRELTTRP